MSKYQKKLIGTCLVAMVVGILTGVVAPVLAEEPEPPRPAWIRADGTIDESQFPANGLPAFDLDGNLACRINLQTYLDAGGAMVVDIVTESNTPVDEFETDASSSHTTFDEHLENPPSVEFPGATLC